MTETIAALSSGLVPSGVAVIRVSGPAVRAATEALAGDIPSPRLASLRRLQDTRSGETLDEALVLFFPRPNSFTGEDVVELHCHGGAAVVEGVLEALWSMDGIRPAVAGEFTRQAFLNGKLDLTQVESVGDLIHASTVAQRQQALDQLAGAGGDQVRGWKEAVADARALLEADLDFSDEDDVPGSVVDSLPERLRAVLAEIDTELVDTFAEKVREGFRVVIAGAPNSGKSTLLNALLRREAAIVSEIAGTTRDRIDAMVELDGLPVVLTDTAGLRSGSVFDPVERMGIERTQESVRTADCILWLLGGDDVDIRPSAFPAEKTIRVRSKADLGEESQPGDDAISVSGKTGLGLVNLKQVLGAKLREDHAEHGTGVGGRVALDARRRLALADTRGHLDAALGLLSSNQIALDHLAEELRLGQRALGTIVGDVDAEGLLDRLFSRFCIGK